MTVHCLQSSVGYVLGFTGTPVTVPGSRLFSIIAVQHAGYLGICNMSSPHPEASMALQAQHVDERTVDSSVSTAVPRHKADIASKGRSPSLPSRHKASAAVVPPSQNPLPPEKDSIHVIRHPPHSPGSTPSNSFPGFAQLAAKQSADAAREMQASKNGPGKHFNTLLFPPVPSQEPVLRPPASSGEESK